MTTRDKLLYQHELSMCSVQNTDNKCNRNCKKTYRINYYYGYLRDTLGNAFKKKVTA